MCASRLFRSLLAAAVLCALAHSAALAGNTRHISGRVTDARGKPLAGVSVVITNTKTEDRVLVISDKVGRFSASGLKPGTYSVTVEPPLTAGANGIRVTLDEKPGPKRKAPVNSRPKAPNR